MAPVKVLPSPAIEQPFVAGFKKCEKDHDVLYGASRSHPQDGEYKPPNAGVKTKPERVKPRIELIQSLDYFRSLQETADVI